MELAEKAGEGERNSVLACGVKCDFLGLKSREALSTS
jgi:hypothetical protein